MVAITVTTQPSIQELMDRVPNGPRRAVVLGSAIDQMRWRVQRNVMDAMPDTATGNMRRSTRSTYDGGLSAEIVIDPVSEETGRGYAAYSNFGVAPHQILARLATNLRFVPRGAKNPQARLTGKARKGQEDAYVYSRAVNHPGQPAQNFLQVGLDNSMEDIRQLLTLAAEAMVGQ